LISAGTCSTPLDLFANLMVLLLRGREMRGGGKWREAWGEGRGGDVKGEEGEEKGSTASLDFGLVSP